MRTTLSGLDGFYAFTNVRPNFGSPVTYSIRFSAPGAGSRTALLGTSTA